MNSAEKDQADQLDSDLIAIVAALQQRLTVADQRVDELEGLLATIKATLPHLESPAKISVRELIREIDAALNPTLKPTCCGACCGACPAGCIGAKP
ncbi:hypothetical protein SAMN03159489_02209 [Pseudomonas sp. NFPP07]|uniref:hypothetical protein n=1 Tax=Pseudomonas sp. NFPP07 TaxID=1566213 RepID=UPI0008ED1D7A|nr:hypothetical protein [Pseudomonas sp. NFPP07]SFP92856.1 hypothetical protein SAMN03159489_02209 [Pseudomonas sp. NFPP07]